MGRKQVQSGRRALLATPLALWLPRSQAATPGEVPIGQPLREARLNGLNGPSRALSSYRGQPLIINVWASWCGPCKAEMASLERLAWSGAAGQATLIGITIDDYRDKALAWLRQSNATITHYIDRQLEMEHMLGANTIPLTVMVDAQGVVRAKVRGAREWDSPEAVKLIREAFKTPAR